MKYQYKNGRFINPWLNTQPTFKDLLRWRLKGSRAQWPRKVSLSEIDCPPERVDGSKLRISYVNHSTLLIQTAGLNILIDPVWAQRVGPWGLLGPKRVHPPGIQFEDLPSIDYILVTHTHYDHLDIHTIRRIYKRDHPVIVSGLKTRPYFRVLGSEATIHTLDWWGYIAIGTIKIHYCPALHWSKRTAFDRNQSLWGGFIIETQDWTVYCAGDTAFYQGSPFEQIAQQFPKIDIACIPIGAYKPRWFMQSAHLDPEEAVRAHQILKPHYFTIPIHYGTFNLSDEGYAAPLDDLKTAITHFNIPENAFKILKPGSHWFHDPT